MLSFCFFSFFFLLNSSLQRDDPALGGETVPSTWSSLGPATNHGCPLVLNKMDRGVSTGSSPALYYPEFLLPVLCSSLCLSVSLSRAPDPHLARLGGRHFARGELEENCSAALQYVLSGRRREAAEQQSRETGNFFLLMRWFQSINQSISRHSFI